jgi:Lrp/AsnC family transcriptional regulator, leucine-responsive regulatory protein
MEPKIRLDAIGRALVEALQANARTSYADLGRAVGLSPPAVAERVKRLEDLGILRGFRADVDRAKLGYSLAAFIRVRCPSEMYGRIEALSRELPDILECHHVTGDDAFILKIIARSVQHLDEVILRLAPYGATTSAIVLSTRVHGKPIQPADR